MPPRIKPAKIRLRIWAAEESIFGICDVKTGNTFVSVQMDTQGAGHNVLRNRTHRTEERNTTCRGAEHNMQKSGTPCVKY